MALPPSAAAAIRYGEFVQAIYDTINNNEGPFWSFPLYGKSRLFEMAALTKSGSDGTGIGNAYTITRYIYCTVQGVCLWKSGTAWIGFIAESTEEETQRLGRRDIVVAIRGTMGTAEWIKDFSFALSDFPLVQTPAAGAQVHWGFLSIYTFNDPTLNFGAESMREQIFTELRARLSSLHGAPASITITGHSLGGALATLAACDVGHNLLPEFANVTVSAITFGSPRVGNDKFKINVEKHTAFISRYRSIADIVPCVPPIPYVHVGTEFVLDWQPSPYVCISRKWFGFSLSGHNLELHMHAMAAENSVAVYTSAELEDLLGGFPLSRAGTTYVIEDLLKMSAWDGLDRDVLKRQLEDVKYILKDDQSQMVAFLKEVNYIAVNRSVTRRMHVNNIVAPRLHALGSQESPFDKRDYSLLNKSDDILCPQYSIPASWMVHSHKDMVRDSHSNRWLPRVERPHDIPTPNNPEYN